MFKMFKRNKRKESDETTIAMRTMHEEFAKLDFENGNVTLDDMERIAKKIMEVSYGKES